MLRELLECIPVNNLVIPNKIGPGRRTIESIHREIDLARPGSYVREANKRNGVGSNGRNNKAN